VVEPAVFRDNRVHGLGDGRLVGEVPAVEAVDRLRVEQAVLAVYVDDIRGRDRRARVGERRRRRAPERATRASDQCDCAFEVERDRHTATNERRRVNWTAVAGRFDRQKAENAPQTRRVPP